MLYPSMLTSIVMVGGSEDNKMAVDRSWDKLFAGTSVGDICMCKAVIS